MNNIDINNGVEGDARNEEKKNQETPKKRFSRRIFLSKYVVDTWKSFRLKFYNTGVFLKEYIIANEKILSIIINIAAIVVAIYLYSITKEQARISRDALRFQRESDSLNTISQKTIADSSIALSKRNAEIAIRYQEKRDSLNFESFKIENRPWIVIGEIPANPIIVNRPYITKVIIRNIGKSPALRIKAIVQRDILKTFPERPIYLDTEQSEVIIGQGQAFEITVGDTTKVFSKELYKRITGKGGERFFVFGYIKYEDIFSEAHTTTFCTYYATDKGKMVFANTYNNID